ncbi:uncharacterized protein LOC129270604 [Lytechinus pictus]|uniref:uncharacterized protein LOC129270604 n=1 Tax=Lytechinus pictus TaxID=7653 RepID=UPI0030B9D905
MEEGIQENGHRLHDDNDMVLTELDTEHDDNLEPENDDKALSETSAEYRVLEDENGNGGVDDDGGEDIVDNDGSMRGSDTSLKEVESENDDEDQPSRGVDSDLDQSESLPSLPDSGQQSDLDGGKDGDTNDHHQNGDKQLKPSSQSIKQDRHIGNALPDDIDLLAEYDDDSIASSQGANKLIWSAFKIAFLISAPVFFIGLAIVIMGAINFPENFNLLPIGIPVFIIAGLVFIGSTAYLCFYKAKKMKLFEFGGNIDGEIAGIGNVGYVHGGDTIVPNTAYNHDQEAMTSHLEGEDSVVSQGFSKGDLDNVQPAVVYTIQDQEETLPL